MKNNIKKTLALITFLSAIFLNGYSREGLKLYSIQNNSPWNSSLTWSNTMDGNPCSLVPQSNDTVIISKNVILNIDFNFSGAGMLIIYNTGLLKAENFNLTFKNNSSLECNGELRVNNISFSDLSICKIENNAIVNVFNSFWANNTTNQVQGKLHIAGTLSSNESTIFSGIGTIDASIFSGSGNIMGVFPASIIPDRSFLTQTNWIGQSSKLWIDAANWSDNQVPDGNSIISILNINHICIVAGSAACSRLIINTNATLEIQPSALLQVSNSLSILNSGRLTLKNTRNEKASLITNGTVEGNIQSEYPVNGKSQQLISSPVKSAPSGTFLNMYLRSYSEKNSQWGDYITPTNTSLDVMQGYELQSLYNETRIFEGTPNSGVIIAPVTNNGNGLNLTGNPYPCYIDWEDNTKSAWQRDKIASAIYYPDPNGSGNYAVYLPGDDAISVNNGSRFIEPMQGFFVKASNQGNIVIKENSRKPFMEDSKATLKNNVIRFKLSSSNGITDEAIFRIKADASEAFDNDLDALKITGNPQNASLYFTDIENNKLAVNTIPYVSSSTIVPLNINCALPETFTLSIQGAFEFEYRYPVMLRDKQLNTLINLRSDSSYTFQHAPNYNSNRFELVFMSPDGIEVFGVKDLAITQVNNSIHIEGSTNELFNVKIFDLSGKLIATQNGIPSHGMDVEINSNCKVIIVQLSNRNKTFAQKIYTNN